MITFDDNYITIEIDLGEGKCTNYNEVCEIAKDLQKVVDDWLTWEVDGDVAPYVTTDWG